MGVKGVDYCEGNLDDIDPSEWQVPPHCVPIHANVVTYDWSLLYSFTQFDVIMMDPPLAVGNSKPHERCGPRLLAAYRPRHSKFANPKAAK